jgi:hypothetical protein
MSSTTTTPRPTGGFAVYAPSGAISWRSIENSREASITAFIKGSGLASQEVWKDLEGAGFCCEPILIAPSYLGAAAGGPVPESVYVNAITPRAGRLPTAEKVANGEFHATEDEAKDALAKLRDNDMAGPGMDTYRAEIVVIERV